MRNLIRRRREPRDHPGSWHILAPGSGGGVVHTYCGWVFVDPERGKEPQAPLCRKCVKKEQDAAA